MNVQSENGENKLYYNDLRFLCMVTIYTRNLVSPMFQDRINLKFY